MIERMFPYPLVLPNGRLRSGDLQDASSICELCSHKECGSTLDKMATAEVRRCSYGYDYFKVVDFEGSSGACVGFLLSGKKFPDRFRKLLEAGYRLSEKNIENIINTYSIAGIVHQQVTEPQRKNESRALHDLKHLITVMQRIVERHDVDRATNANFVTQQDWEILRNTVDSIYKVLSAIKNQIEFSEYIISPDLIDLFEEKMDINMDGLFVKNIGIYSVLAKQHNIIINPLKRQPQQINEIRNVNKLFVLIPPILLENAIKYTYYNDSISITENLNNGKLSFSVSSFGVLIPDEMRDKIWNLGGQYINEYDTNRGGGGFGLYLARKICDRCGFNIGYFGEYVATDDGMPMGWNKFVLSER